ncbi:Linear gramicidin dehydrogenase LgrE [Enhygromyxa salina]|uniref:Linear gramicidin dehydrogenase LgrE n=1 Tax=Enhygromyxa salina TaxID=215803 RepID=A0A2S9XFL6_9BACT|nr:Linear gramicidin dehydrogenase LgrE [Enhygromyxa salina]
MFQPWTASLPHDVELRVVQLPGRQERGAEAPMTQLREMVERVLEALQAIPSLPSTLYGHSLGGVLAFEVARRLEARGQAPRLVVGACRPPHHEPRPAQIRHLPSGDFIAALERRYGTPSELRSPQLQEIALPVLRADITAVETHRFESQPTFGGDLTILVGHRDKSASPELAAGWRALTKGALRVHQIDGGHLFIDTHSEWVRQHVSQQLG